MTAMTDARAANLPLPIRRPEWGRLLLWLVGAWCVFWWGFAAGMQNANQAELRSLRTRLLLWDGVERESPDVARLAKGVAAMERQHMSDLTTLVNSSTLYVVFAPLLLPYTAYRLHQLDMSLHREQLAP